jgi:hypothetical protein
MAGVMVIVWKEREKQKFVRTLAFVVEILSSLKKI